ncbi:MmyB family transcriptional regulator [Nocardia niigatensis]
MKAEQSEYGVNGRPAQQSGEQDYAPGLGERPGSAGSPRRDQARPNTRLIELRIARGWTQEQVAHAIADLAAARGKTTGITANTVSRLERGSCSWPQSLVAEFECLFECPAAEIGFVNRRVGRGVGLYRGTEQDFDGCAADPAEHAFQALLPAGSGLVEPPRPEIYSPMLAAYGTPQLYILANNEEFRRAFPGITVGTNLLEWAALDPIAREVLVEWEMETELLGNSLRQAAANPHNGEARAILGKCLDQSPAFRKIYARGNTAIERPYSYQLLRDLDTGEVTRVDCNIWVAFTNGKPAHFYIGKPDSNRTPE